MISPISLDDNYLIRQLNNDNREVFEIIFNYYYSGLVIYADKILNDINLSEDIVQSVFVKFWENRKQLSVRSLRSYLVTSVRNRSIDHLRANQVKSKYLEKTFEELEQTAADDFITYKELNEIIDQAIQKLPPRCKEIFELNRFQDLKIKEIAAQLNISGRTVETQISKALRILRVELKDYLSYLLLIIFLK